MRIYTSPMEALKETERDLWEMGIDVHPQTMQDKQVGDNIDYKTKEMQAYGFQIVRINDSIRVDEMVAHIFGKDTPAFHDIMTYIAAEFRDRVSRKQTNPGTAWKFRQGIWSEFLHKGKFSYTYSERMAHQIGKVIAELKLHPDTRQGIINIHSNICPIALCDWADVGSNEAVVPSADFHNTGGSGRIPCSMYYQIMQRRGRIDLIYTMRSCDFLTHFVVDFSLALMLQDYFCEQLEKEPGVFTYFTGSLHAYHKDMRERGIF